MEEAKRHLFWKNSLKARYIKWEVLEAKFVNADDSYMQISELRFIDNDATIFQWPSEAECIDHSDWLTTAASGQWMTKEQGGECAERLLDGSVNTKFTTKHHAKFPFHITFDLGSQCLDIGIWNRYQWYTANDDTTFSKRTPTSWNMFGSADGNSWTLLDHVEGFTAPIANYTLAYTSGRIS